MDSVPTDSERRIELWRVGPAAENFPWAYKLNRFRQFLIDGEFDGPSGGQPLGPGWQGAEYGLDRASRKQAPGSFAFATFEHIIFVAESIKDEFESRFGYLGETCPVTVDGRDRDFVAFNVLAKRSCIDWARTEVSIPMAPTRVVADLSGVSEGELFHDIGTQGGSLFSVEGPEGRGLRAICQEKGWTGLHFQKWFPPKEAV